MGVVWRAFDEKLNAHVAVKTLLDSFDRDAFDRFQDECKKLAGLPYHSNIIRIMDVGEIEQDGRQKPFFVMPLLDGATLAELLQRKAMKQSRLELLLSKKTALAEFLSGPDEKLPAARIIEIICQVCKGLQVAHQNGIIHRDIKPSNIFVLSDFSVQIIDFGVARRTDGESGTIGWKGTIPYMSPEQVQFKPLTTASDIFSLGVVCYEALVGHRPFTGKSNTEVAEAIVWHNPKVPHEVAPVKVAISQAVFKALAKQSDNRYLTASEFGYHLSRALALGDADLFPLPRPRLALAAEYHAKGNDDGALKLLESLHVEGISHPEISQLREQVDSSLRRKRIEEGIAASRSLIEVREYDQAVRNLNQVLAEDPGNPTVLALVKEIETRRTDADVEELLRQTRRQMDLYDFPAARGTLERVRKRRPKDPRMSQFSIELNRIEEEYEQLRKERQRLYDAARSAFERRDISSARSHVRKLAALDELHPDAPNPKSAEVGSMLSQVEAEQAAIDAALGEAHRLIGTNQLAEALEICLAQLAKYPANEHFLHLQFQVEEVQRQALADTIRETDALLRVEPDLMNQEKLLLSRTQQYPGESHFLQALERTKKLRVVVDEIAARARAYEADKAFQEAQQEWQKMTALYARYPGLQTELDRVAARRVEQERRQRKEKLTQQVHREIDRKEFETALATLARAANEFPNDRELAALDALAQAALKSIESAQALLRRGAELCAAGQFQEGLDLLRQAHALDREAVAVCAGLVDGLLAYASSVQKTDPAAAEASVREALEIDPEHPGARDRLDVLLETRHDEFVTACIADSLDKESQGDLLGALRLVEPAIRDYPKDERLAARQESLRKKLGDKAPPIPAPRAPVDAGAAVLEDATVPAASLDGTQPPGTWYKTVEDEQADARAAAARTDPGVQQDPAAGKADAAKEPSITRTSARKWLVWGAAASTVVAILIAILIVMKPVPVEKALAEAVVQAGSSPLRKERRASSASLMTIHKGQRVMVLERIRADTPFIRVQFVSPKLVSRPGFVRRADLTGWNEQFSWDALMLAQPPEGANEPERLRFAEALVEFSRKFPGHQADLARLQAAQLYLGVASEAGKGGGPTASIDENLDKAEGALSTIGKDEADEAARLGDIIAQLRQHKSPPPPSPPHDPRLIKLYTEAVRLRDEGKLREALNLLMEALRIDPHYDPALRFKNTIEDMLRILDR